MLLEFDPSVERFDVRALRLEWLDTQRRPHPWPPYILALYDLGRRHHKLLYEVKCRSELRREC